MHSRALALSLVLSICPAICAAQLTADPESYSTLSNQVEQHRELPILSGTITGFDGSPLNNIRIEVRSLATAQVVGFCYSGLNGSFSLSSIRPGNYEVVAFDGLEESRQEVELHGGLATVNLRVPRKTATPKNNFRVSVAEMKIPEKARHLLDKARTALVHHHTDEAQKEVESALTIAPDYADALTTRAVLRLDAKQTSSALDDLDHAIKVDSSYAPAYLVMGAAYNQMGRFDDALRTLDRGARFDPSSWQSAFETAKAWMGKHEYQHALVQLDRAQSLGASQVIGQIHIMRGYALLAEKHLQEASAELQTYLTAEPNGQLAPTARAQLAKIKTMMTQSPSTLTLPAMSIFDHQE